MGLVSYSMNVSWFLASMIYNHVLNASRHAGCQETRCAGSGMLLNDASSLHHPVQQNHAMPLRNSDSSVSSRISHWHRSRNIWVRQQQDNSDPSSLAC